MGLMSDEEWVSFAPFVIEAAPLRRRRPKETVQANLGVRVLRFPPKPALWLKNKT